jgi:hypothetical protein
MDYRVHAISLCTSSPVDLTSQIRPWSRNGKLLHSLQPVASHAKDVNLDFMRSNLQGPTPLSV